MLTPCIRCRVPVDCLVRTPYPPKILRGHIRRSQDGQLQYHLAMNRYYLFPTTPHMLTPRIRCRVPVDCLVRTPYPPKILRGHIRRSQDGQLQYHLAMNRYYLFPTTPRMLTPCIRCRVPVDCLVRTPYPPKILHGHIRRSQDGQLQYHLAMNRYYLFPTTPCVLTPRVRRICHFQLQSPRATLTLRHWWPLPPTQPTQTTRTSYWISIMYVLLWFNFTSWSCSTMYIKGAKAAFWLEWWYPPVGGNGFVDHPWNKFTAGIWYLLFTYRGSKELISYYRCRSPESTPFSLTIWVSCKLNFGEIVDQILL